MKLLLHSPPPNRSERIKQLEALVASWRDDLWPQIFVRLAEAYYAEGLKEKAYQEFLWFKAFEPDDYRNQTDFYKSRLARYVSLDEFKEKFIIDNDSNKIDEYKVEPIYYAARAGRVDIYNWLRNNGASKPLPAYVYNQAISSRRPEMVRQVLETLSDIFDTKINHRNQIREINEMLEGSLGDREDLEEIRRMLEAD